MGRTGAERSCARPRGAPALPGCALPVQLYSVGQDRWLSASVGCVQALRTASLTNLFPMCCCHVVLQGSAWDAFTSQPLLARRWLLRVLLPSTSSPGER